MVSRPLVALHMSALTKTALAGLNAAGRMNGSVFVLVVVLMAPLRWTIPEMVRTAGGAPLAPQPLMRVRLVQPVASGCGPAAACAAPAPQAVSDSMSATALSAAAASLRGLR